MKTLAALIISSTISLVSRGQAPSLKNWTIDTLPTGDKIYSANQSHNDWTFTDVSGKWEIIQNSYSKEKGDVFPFSAAFIDKNLKQLKANRFVKRTPDGYLVGLDKGEFGGGLYFVKPDGLDSYQITDYLNIRSIFEYEGRYFALEGLAHLGIQEGQIIEIIREDAIWKYKSLTRLIDAPALIADYKDGKVIVTSQYILKFGGDLKVTQILKSPFYWGMLYPSSLLIDNNDLYLAMRQGVLKITSFDSKPEYIWYTPK